MIFSKEQRETFKRQGYLVVPGLYTPEEMDEIRGWVDEAQGWPEEKGGAWMYFEETADGRRLLNRMERFIGHHAGLDAVARGERMLGSCADLIGEPVVLFKDKINFKFPGGGGFEAHQDVQAGWARYGRIHVTALLTIDPATRANGCLEIAKAFDTHDLIGREWEPLTQDDLTDVAFEHIESEPGDAVFFDSFVPHRSEPNRTDTARRVLYITYGREADGDQMERYYADKFEGYPPDIEREDGREYRYKV